MKKTSITLAIIVSLVAACACYAEEKKLTEKQAMRLVGEYKVREQAANTKIKGEEDKIAALHGEIAKLDAQIASLIGKMSMAEAEKPKHDIYVVRKGDWLAKLAEYPQVYGHGNYALWPRIYKANKDLIKNPTLIYPGWELKIPR